MLNVFDKVDELVSELNSHLPITPQHQKKLDKKFRLEFNYNSNHIEGNTLTYGETELLLLFDDTKGNHTLREYEEMKAHDVAWQLIEEWAKDAERPLTEQNIKNLNEVILVRPFWKEAITPDGQATRRQIKVGDYKAQPNSVRLANGEIFEYASPLETPIQMQELIDWYRSEEKKMHPVTLAAMLHYKFVRIHPFDDGNGRVSRLLMNYVLLRNGFPPVIIKSSDKVKYLNNLHQADIGDYAPFIEYVAEQLIWSLEISIKAAKGESIEEQGDLDKRLAMLEKELEAVDPNEEVKLRYSKEVFVDIFYSWVRNLIKASVPEIQKFNRFFTGMSHYIQLANGFSSTQFTNETPDEIIEKLENQFVGNKNHFQEFESLSRINTQYGTLIKGGLKTFGCNYSIEIKFYTIKYEVFVDEFVEEGKARNQVMLFERLLHKPLTETEIQLVVKYLTDAIFEHIDYNTKIKGLR